MGQAKRRKDKGEYPARTKRERTHKKKIKHSPKRNLLTALEDSKGTKYEKTRSGLKRRA